MKIEKNTKSYVAYMVVVISSILWGTTFLGGKMAMSKMNPLEVMAGRCTIATLFFLLLILFGLVKVSYRNKPVWKLFVISLMQPCISMTCESCGLNMTTASLASIMYAMIPVIVMFISITLLRKPVDVKVVFGVGVAFVGIVLTILGNAAEGEKSSVLGIIFLAGMALSGAIYVIISKWIAGSFSAVEITFAQVFGAMIWFNVASFGVYGKNEWVSICAGDKTLIVLMIFLGTVGSAVCYLGYNFALRRIDETKASMIQVNVTSMTGVFSGILILNDPFTLMMGVGVLMVATGVFLTNVSQK